MNNCFLSVEKRNIKKLINDLSKVLNVDISALNFLEEKLNIIISNNSLNDMLESYFTLLENEMINLITSKITPSFQVGIKNKYFTIIGYTGKVSSTLDAKEIDENTYYSFDSISKVLTSIVTMMMIRDGKVTLDMPINSFNSSFEMNASISSILNFTASIRTEKRIDNLSREETIEILKKCRESIIDKPKAYYQYNDLGYMILRLSIPHFLERLDIILELIDKDNLTYKNMDKQSLITGGRLELEHITPDQKGRGILFPGHTGLYGNMMGLLNLYSKIINNEILSKEELDILLKQPYDDPRDYNRVGKYTAKIAGFYRKPNNIVESNFDKMLHCDFSNLTTDKALASSGTCGSWVMGDNLAYENSFGAYVGGILTNPYTYVNIGDYPNDRNIIPNSNLIVNKRGIILGYSGKLNPYKEIVARYGILLELLTEYIKNTYPEYDLDNKHITYKRVLKKS